MKWVNSFEVVSVSHHISINHINWLFSEVRRKLSLSGLKHLKRFSIVLKLTSFIFSCYVKSKSSEIIKIWIQSLQKSFVFQIIWIWKGEDLDMFLKVAVLFDFLFKWPSLIRANLLFLRVNFLCLNASSIEMELCQADHSVQRLLIPAIFKWTSPPPPISLIPPI